jgi:hypothetical protein
MIISLFMGTPVASRRRDRAADAYVERDGRERGSQPDGQRQPKVVEHRRDKNVKFSAVSYQLSAISKRLLTES